MQTELAFWGPTRRCLPSWTHTTPEPASSACRPSDSTPSSWGSRTRREYLTRLEDAIEDVRVEYTICAVREIAQIRRDLAGAARG